MTMPHENAGDSTTTATESGSDPVETGFRRLRNAVETHTPCDPIRDLIGPADVASAYAIQQRLNAARTAAGAAVVGRKIGLTNPAVQAQLGVDQPDFGVLFDDMGYAESQIVPMSRLLQPKAEAEIAFVLAADLSDGDLDIPQVRAAVAHAQAAIEIVDSRIAEWNITFADTVADNASSGLYVLGSALVPLSEFEPAEADMSMTIDGEVVSTGRGSACLGDPLNALSWLARTAREFGEPLRAGQVILSGALGPVQAVPAGAVVRAEISGLGSVTARFSEEET
ncbi:MAG: 2-keto-4-pentenoate hydratase [Nocardioides sp.]